MTKKISMNDWTYIGKYNPAAKWLRPFCSYSLTKTDNGFLRSCKLSWLVYLLLFLPVHLFKLFVCMWDGGLKNFELEPRILDSESITENGLNFTRYPMAKEIWEKA